MMNNVSKRLFTFCMLCFCTLCMWAQHSFTAQGPHEAAVGEPFRITYTVSTDDAKNFKAGMMKGFNLIAGPYTSTMSSVSIVNFKTTSRSSITYTLTLMPTAVGDYTIQPATIQVGGSTLTSKPLHIRVAEGNPNTSSRSNSGGGSSSGRTSRGGSVSMPSSAREIGANDLFIVANISKTTVHEQEALLLTYKIYTRVSLQGFNNVKLPDMEGFHSQEIVRGQNIELRSENYHGRTYQSAIYRQFLLFPQKTGKLSIPSAQFDAAVVLREASADPFMAILNGTSQTMAQKTLRTKAVTINVLPLPGKKPEGFTGGVGNMKITSSLPSTHAKTGDALSLKIVVSGSGNLKLVTAPTVAFPKDFEVYDPKVTENFKPGQGGMVGTKVFEYLAVPRNVGKYTIPAVTFSYYDTGSDSYKTLHTQPYEVQVEKGKGSTSQQGAHDFTEMEQIATDIRYIKKGEAHTVSSDYAWGSALQGLAYLLSFLIFVTLMVIYRKQALENANMALTKGKRANKMAGKRLKTAKKLLDKHDYDAFYDEVIRALWGYVSDKLTIPTAQLTKENVALKLVERGATETTTNLFLGALNECEFAKYAPGDKNKVMDEMYVQTIQLISKLEEELKGAKGKSPVMTCILVLFLAFAGTTGVFAQSQKAQADSAYAQNNYQKAAILYQYLLKQGKSPEIYYNLGNCYYRMDHLAQSLLAYERAALLNPSDKDIQANLDFVRAQTPDKAMPGTSIFYEMWWNSARSSLGLATWTWLGALSFAMFLGLTFLYFVTSSVRWKKIGFFAGVFCLVVCLVTNAFAYGQYQQLTHRHWAIITAPSVTVKSSPSDTGTDLLLIHEGYKVEITDDSMKAWREIQLEEGKVGWIKVSDLEVI